MTETVTLELPEEVANRAREAATRLNRPLEAVLTEWIERAAQSEDTTLLLSSAEYPIYTPYGNEAAAQVLWDTLNRNSSPDDKGI
jgi:hypothetical protein